MCVCVCAAVIRTCEYLRIVFVTFVVQVNGSPRSHTRSMAGMGGHQSYEESRSMLGLPSNMTKSMSTPSIPAATAAQAAASMAGKRTVLLPL
jgi:hypothetical protein